ncbi:MAG TPA: FliM/FliN family flagellar motor switch protein, partial [Parachlamydiaceae bacterium]|nr:FliM/FliN family flagellar motor switch protein [Parachlamydiaceae bacterium]
KSEAQEAMAKDTSPDDDVSELGDDFTFSDTLDEETSPENRAIQEEEEEETETKAEDVFSNEEKDPEDSKEENAYAPITSGPKFNPEEMVLDVIVEVGRLEMSIEKLTELQPGNILEIDVRPENGVDLVVNGKRIGKGELLKLGEVLGVRILDI